MELPDDDLYKIMGVERDATEEVIKKAYRKLARQYHPDRNPGDKEAEEMFKKVQGAYDILGDADKRAMYDRKFFAPPPPVFTQQQNNNLQDLFDMFFSQRPRQQGWGQHIEMEIIIDFIEAAKGCSKVVNIDKREVCRHCKGTSAKDGNEFKECVLCDGRGKTYFHHGTSNSFSRWETTCQSCKGTGKVVAVFCPYCSGNGFTTHPCTLELKIPAGINDGMKICARGEGDIGLSGCGNLYCVVRVKAHPVFQREGINLCLKLPITYTQAVFGGEIDVPCMDGQCKFKLPAGTRSGAIFRMPGLGFTLPDDDESARGDLLVKVVIDVPTGSDLPDSYKESLHKIAEFEKDHLGDSRRNFKRNLEESK
jgi:molecular chaperone DnaJ